MSRVFLDVGTHEGQTLEEVIDPSYAFDRILAFEPMPAQYAMLLERDWPAAVELCNYGLNDRDGDGVLYGANEGMEASLYPTKLDVDPSVETTVCFRRASTVVSEIPVGDVIVMKLNCEGAEVPILRDLIATEMIWRIWTMMIDFDIRKVVGHAHEQQEVLDQLNKIGFDRFVLSEAVMVGETHQARIRNWLAGLPPIPAEALPSL